MKLEELKLKYESGLIRLGVAENLRDCHDTGSVTVAIGKATLFDPSITSKDNLAAQEILYNVVCRKELTEETTKS